MIPIHLKPLQHRDMERIGIYFEKNASIQSLLQKQAGARWSSTHSCWHVPCTKESYEAVAAALIGRGTIQRVELDRYLLGKNADFAVTPSINIPLSSSIKPSGAKVISSPSSEKICPENMLEYEKYKNKLVLKGYSKSTLRTYCGEFSSFIKVLGTKLAKDLSPNELQRYILYCINTLKLSENTVHSRINALKFYYEQVLHKEKMFFEIPRPKKQKQLPGVFNQDEIAAIINSLDNKKHKAMLMLAYSGGLRVSEIVTIKTFQVDSKRMTIFISQAKGKKDRIVALSPVLLVMLREYAKEFKPLKNGFLFMGSIPGTPYSSRSLQTVLQAAKKKAGVTKPGSIHSLRHSFATHLIEKGTDVTMIQKLLGHNDLKTTMIYLHTSNKDLIKIISPLDDLKLT